MSAEFHPSDFRRGLRYAGLTHGEFRVAVELCEYAAVDEPIVWPSVKTLAETAGMTERGVQIVFKGLTRKRVIVCVETSRGGSGKTNRWRLLVVPKPRTGVQGLEEKTPNECSGFSVRNPERKCPKPRTKTRETPNWGSPEVVRSREEVGDARASATPTPRPPEFPSEEESPFHLTAGGKVVCAKHVGTEGTAPCWSCGEARKAYEAGCAAEAEAEHTRRATERVQCEQCDTAGWRLDHGGRDGDRPKKCDHKQAS